MRAAVRLGILALIVVAAGAAWWYQVGRSPGPAPDGDAGRRVAVEAASVTTGTIRDVRSFTGTLEAEQAFTVAPKIAGQVEEVAVDIGERVERGQVVVALDDEEARQAVAEAGAALAVARAERDQARADARLAQRELERTRRLAGRDMASASQLDTAEAGAEAKRAAVAVAEARVQQRAAALRRARVQLGYTRVRANWTGSGDTRLVAARMVDPGDTVSAHQPLLDVVHVRPLTAVIQVPEEDYPRLAAGQAAMVTSESLPGQRFAGRIARLAPRFAEDSRRARVEIAVPNPDRHLKPGMFVDVAVTVGEAAGATLVPAEAVVRRREQRGVYRLSDDDPPSVAWTPVTVGIEGDERVQILAPEDLSGRVVRLGQQLLEDGAPVTVAELPAP
ncbi:MAG TPA: efflux RND transporter periplasmic adaptor subunit [Gammaproteobacteria bacterium]|nr:efflux RND transporter periplasmic adaptor subunit [Gammaproteobacteria bacterium]